MTNQTYYVIWRGDEDQFLITAVYLPPADYDLLDNNDLIRLCHDVEYGDDPDTAGEYPDSYDLIEVITGTDVRFVGNI